MSGMRGAGFAGGLEGRVARNTDDDADEGFPCHLLSPMRAHLFTAEGEG